MRWLAYMVEQDRVDTPTDRGTSTAGPQLRESGQPVDLPDGLLELLHQPSPCFIATLMPDGSPQLTQTWVDTDGAHILVNTVAGFQKVKNMSRDPRVALNISDPANPSRYFAVRGRVVDITLEGAVDHIEKLAQRYLGGPYPWFGGRDQTRLLVTIEAEKISATG